MSRLGLLASMICAVGCSKTSSELDPEKTSSLFTEVTLDTANGLSGLAGDGQGRL